jgi:hypothetical protein
MEPNNGGIKAWQWIVTVIVIIALIVVGIIVFGNKKTDTGTTDVTDTTVTDTTDVGTEVNRIIMADQFPGNVVFVSSVQLAKGGWVVIHKDNAGKPGDIIGSTYFDSGINPGKVTLTASTVEGGVYYAMLHTDDGDKKFDAAKDLPLKDSKGDVIMKIFRAGKAAEVNVKG